MFRIVLSRDLQHEQIEFPPGTPHPEGRRGGGSGSLHLRRGSVRDVSDEELAFIKAERPEVFKCLDVLPAPKQSPALTRKLRSLERQKAREAVPASSTSPKPPTSGKPSGKPSGRSKKASPKKG